MSFTVEQVRFILGDTAKLHSAAEPVDIQLRWATDVTIRLNELLVALLASRALEEAKWWWERLDECSTHDESCQKRIAALEQAAAKEGK